MGLAQAAYLYRRYKLVDYLNPIANYDFILGCYVPVMFRLHFEIIKQSYFLLKGFISS